MSEFNPKTSNVSKEFKEFLASVWTQHKFPVIFFVVIFLGLGLLGVTLLTSAYNAIITPKTQIEDTKKLEAETEKRIQAEKLAEEEKQKREQGEKAKQELEQKIANATKVDLNYDQDSDLGSQNIEQAKSSNLAIAGLGNSTQNAKLFEVLSVVDGDTVKVSELGTLRLIGIDTPETKDPRKPVQCFGKEASNRATELLSGKKVYLEFDPANRIDKYGRTLAYLYREDGYFFNAEMIKDGFANSYTKFPHPRLEEFNTYAKLAREGQKGLWSPATCNGDATKPETTTTSSTATTSTNTTKTPSTTNPIPSTSTPTTNGYIAGTCADLKAKYGIGNFKPGDPNYTKTRDRNGDGVACEM